MSVTLASAKAIYDLSEVEFHRIQKGDPEGFQALLEALTESDIADLLDWLCDPCQSIACKAWVRH